METTQVIRVIVGVGLVAIALYIFVWPTVRDMWNKQKKLLAPKDAETTEIVFPPKNKGGAKVKRLNKRGIVSVVVVVIIIYVTTKLLGC